MTTKGAKAGIRRINAHFFGINAGTSPVISKNFNIKLKMGQKLIKN
jgi:hypothetical protein